MQKSPIRIALLVLAAGLCLWAQDADTDEQPERIRSFDSQITVNQDGSMEVQETIAVTSAGQQMKHGIYRDFPTKYKDRLGNAYVVEFDVLSLIRDGNAEPYHTSVISNGARVYFGSASYLLPPGPHTYRFTYRTNRQLGFFRDHDELYWNVTGNGWAFPIDRAGATVLLPTTVRDAIREVRAYAGYQGYNDLASQAARDRQGNPEFGAENLRPQQGLSIVVTWPKGLIAEPTRQQKLTWLLADNRAAVFGLAGFAVILLYYFIVWGMVGRDPKPGTIVPLYEPQDGLSPAAMRYLERMAFDEKVFTSAILGLAAKGYLTIEEDHKKTYHLKRKPGYGTVEKTLSSDERLLAERLFSDGQTLDIKQENHSRLQEAQTALKNSLRNAMEKTYFLTNVRYLWPGVGLTALTVLAMVAASPGDMVATIFISVWLTGWSVGVSFLLVMLVHAWKAVFGGGGLKGIPGAFFITLFSMPFLCGEGFGVFMLWSAVGPIPVAVLFLGIGSGVLFHYLLKAPTRAGRQLLDRIDGFKMFLNSVEGPQYALASPAKTPELFERFLPYALALSVEHAWAQQFSGVLAAAAASGSSHGGYSPSWYTGAEFSAFSPSVFASSFSSSFSSAISSASTSPGSSSGSGGGGSSGGGGGGGGGGGW